MDTQEPTDKTTGLDVPETVQEEARHIVTDAFRLFSDHTRRMTDDLTEFNEKRRKVTESIDRGARQTSGRIV
jgi:hypothetical protein